MEELNGRIKLSWPQIVYGITILTVILLTYADLKNNVANMSIQVNKVYMTQVETHNIIDELKTGDREIVKDIHRIKKKLKMEDD